MSDTIIDPEVFETLKTMAGADYIAVLIDAYFEDSATQFSEMRSALEAGNCPQFARAAHSLKGNSANFGAAHLTVLARELEYLGKSSSLEGAGSKLDALLAEYERVKTALEELRDGI